MCTPLIRNNNALLGAPLIHNDNALLGAPLIHGGQVDERGLRNVHTGTYTFRFGVEEMPRDQGFLAHTFEAY